MENGPTRPIKIKRQNVERDHLVKKLCSLKTKIDIFMK